MATRIYLPSSGAAPVTLAYAAGWEDTTIASRLEAVADTPSATAMSTVAFTEATNTANWDVLFRQWVIEVGAQTFSAQTIKFQMRGVEPNASGNMFFSWGIRCIAPDGTVRGTLVGPQRRDSTELALSGGGLTNRGDSVTSTSVTAQSGDYLVIEVGTGGTPGAKSDHDSSIRIGDNGGSDLPENDTDTTDKNPWIEFANTISFATLALITGVTATATAAGIAGVVTAQAGVSVSVTGVTASAPASGIAGAVAAVRIVTIAGVTGEAPAEGIAGAVAAHIQATITGVTATATAAGVAGVVATIQYATVTGVTGAASAEGVAGVVAAQNQVTIVGVTATADAAGIAGSVAAQVQIAVTGVTGAASADGIAGTVAAVRIVTITGVTGQAPAAGVAGVVAAVQIVVVTGVTGTATAEGFAGTATGVRLSVILIARYAPLSEFTARYAPQTEVSARYAPQSEFSGRYAPQTETEARYG